jgi:hypothetical protein
VRPALPSHEGIVIGRAENPDAGLIHLHHGIYTLGNHELQDFHGGWLGYRIPIESDHFELMARQRQSQSGTVLTGPIP